MSSSTKPIGLGFVGLSAKGWAANSLAPPLFQEPLSSHYSLAAVSTTRQESAEESAKVYGEKTGKHVEAYHGSTDAIAADPNVQLVVVSVKAPMHKDALVPVVKAKKDVFSEWPLGKNLEETKELARLAREAGIRTFIGLQAWQSPLTTKIHQWVGEGKIGRIMGVTIIASKPRDLGFWGPVINPGFEYSLDPANGGTVLKINIGHDLSAITRMFGPIKSVSATSGKAYPTSTVLNAAGERTDVVLPHPAPDHWSITGTFRDHPGAIFNGFWRTVPIGGKNDVHRPSLLGIIDGEEGAIRFEVFDPITNINLVTPPKVYLNDQEFVLEDTPFLGNTKRNWEEIAKGEKGQYATWEDAVVLHELLDAIEISAEKGIRVVL